MANFLQLKNRRTGEILRMRRVRDASGELVLMIEGSLPAHADGPPLHMHVHEREEVVVKAGTLGAQIGNEKIVVHARRDVSVRGGSCPSVVECGGRSAGAERPRDSSGRSGSLSSGIVYELLNASESGRPSVFYLAHVFWRHRKTQVIVKPPRIIQRIVFPVVLFVGRIFGEISKGELAGFAGIVHGRAGGVICIEIAAIIRENRS